MKIKKFSATTEQEAVEMVKKELGLDALIINIKKIQHRGMFAFFKKPRVEVMAAFDEAKGAARAVTSAIEEREAAAAIQFENSKKDIQEAARKAREEAAPKDALKNDSEEKIQMLQDMLLTTSDMLRKTQSQLSVARHKSGGETRRYQNNLLQVFYDAMIENEVSAEISREILDELDHDDLTEKLDLNFIAKIVYNSLVGIIGEPEGLQTRKAKGSPQIFAFIGPTGVGKTTTIAKLTADLSLTKGMDVGLITADTYRIAAVEQLKTYGDILGIDVDVAYKPEELAMHIGTKKANCDIILIDTAGRSHKNSENLGELKEMLDSMADIDKFLVLSLTTKLEDMLDIVNSFSQLCDFKIIFTKLDETNKMGNIANICHKTGRKLSYITFGQNVPDDIKTIAPGEVAMRLLGL